MLLGDIEIKRLIEEYGLISDYVDLDTQLQPTGFDLTVADIEEITTRGVIDFDNSKRVIASSKSILALAQLSNDLQNESYYWNLKPNRCYRLKFNEEINIRDIPYPISIISCYRSSMMRNGAPTAIGHWDYGYRGKGQTFLNVINPHGVRIYRDARVHQCYFFKTTDVSHVYNGQYLGE